MKISGMENNSFYKKISGDSNKQQKPQDNSYDNFARNLGAKTKREDEWTNTEQQEKPKSVRNAQIEYRSNCVSSQIAVLETGHIKAGAVMECSTRHITYQESDNVKVCIAEGYTLKAQVELTEHKVYIEQKNEDGTVQAYMVNPLEIAEDTENPIEQMALESWEMARKAMQGDGTFQEISLDEKPEGEKKLTDMSFEEAMFQFYQFVEDRIKNGPPKIRIGGSEFSVEEWEKLIEKIDKTLEEIKEELEARIEKQKEEEKNSVEQKRVKILLEDRDC